MTSSHLTRLRNEIAALESQSWRFVPREKYYAVQIQLPNIDIPHEKINKWGKGCVLNQDHQPLFVYVCQNEIYLFFSCLKEGSHFMGGNHQAICSLYSSKFTRKVCKTFSLSKGNRVNCRLIELETQNKIFTFMLWKNTRCSFRCLASHLEIPLERAFQRTFQESVASIKGTAWENIPKSEKYGVIYKLKDRKGKTILSSLSTLLDARKKEHYTSYFFG